MLANALRVSRQTASRLLHTHSSQFQQTARVDAVIEIPWPSTAETTIAHLQEHAPTTVWQHNRKLRANEKIDSDYPVRLEDIKPTFVQQSMQRLENRVAQLQQQYQRDDRLLRSDIQQLQDDNRLLKADNRLLKADNRLLKASQDLMKLKTDRFFIMSVQVTIRQLVSDVRQVLWPLAAKQLNLKSKPVPDITRADWNKWISIVKRKKVIGGKQVDISHNVRRDLSKIPGEFMMRILYWPAFAASVQQLNMQNPIAAGHKGAHFHDVEQKALALAVVHEDATLSGLTGKDIDILLKLLDQDLRDEFWVTLKRLKDLQLQVAEGSQ